MDRGRAGGYVTDNNLAMKQIKEKQFNEHLQRLEKIKSRKAGSSHTLDNNPPVIVKAALANPRKIALRNEFNNVVAKENKSLLKRISMILTAPPRITTKDYYEMKKLCAPGTVDAKEAFEMRLREEKTKKFFSGIKHVKPVYNYKQWEEDYKKQKFNQKFMSQVKYRRPKGFVDPFNTSNTQQEASSATSADHSVRKSHNNRSVLDSGASNNSESFPLITELSSDTNDNYSTRDNNCNPNDATRRRSSKHGNSGFQESPESMQKSKSASHVDRIRAVKTQKGAPGPVRSRTQQFPAHAIPHTKVSTTTEEDERGNEEEYFLEGEETEENNEKTMNNNNNNNNNSDDAGYDQDFEEINNNSNNENIDVALSLAAAAGPRQQSSRGQRRHYQSHHNNQTDEEQEYDDGFEPVSETEQNAITVVVFTGDDEYNHDGFYGEVENDEILEGKPFVVENKQQDEEEQEEKPIESEYENDSDFVNVTPSDMEDNVLGVLAIVSEVDTDIEQLQEKESTLYCHDRELKSKHHNNNKNNNSNNKHVSKPTSRASNPQKSFSTTPDNGDNHNNSNNYNSNKTQRNKSPHNNTTTKDISSAKPASSSSTAVSSPNSNKRNIRKNTYNRALSSSETTSVSTANQAESPSKHRNLHHHHHRHHHQKNDTDSAAGHHHDTKPDKDKDKEERRISIVTLTRPIKLMREVMSAHNPIVLTNPHHHLHRHHHNSNGTTNNTDTNNNNVAGVMLHKARDGFEMQISYMDAQIQCYLVNQAILLITVDGINTEVVFKAEAIISEQDLTMICDLPVEEEEDKIDNNVETAEQTKEKKPNILRDLDALTSIATEIVENIELRMDFGNEARVILNLIHQIDPEEGVQAGVLMMNPPNFYNNNNSSSSSSSNNGNVKMDSSSYNNVNNSNNYMNSNAAMPRTQSFGANAVPFNVVEDEEVEEILLTEKNDMLVLSGGLKMPVHYNMQNQHLSISNINKLVEFAKQSQRVDYVHVLYRARVIKEEILHITATTVNATLNHNSSKNSAKLAKENISTGKNSVGSNLIKNALNDGKTSNSVHPSVPATQVLQFKVTLPAVVQLDSDLFADFAANVVSSLKIDHEVRTGLNSLVMQ